MSNETTRRSLVRGLAWTTPIIAVVACAPAYAASRPLDCAPTAECKLPGEGGSSTKDYRIRTNCSAASNPVVKVEVYDDVQEMWIEASRSVDGTFTAKEFNDSRRNRQVRVTDAFGQSQIYTIPFPPC